MVSIDDFIIKERNGEGFVNLYLPKIEQKQKRNIRILENRDSSLILKFIKTHEYLPGVGNSTCNMTETNLKNGKHCKFCVEFINQINKINGEQFDWLKTTSIVDTTETNQFNSEVLKTSSDKKQKIILKNGKVFEIGQTYGTEISSILTDNEKKTYGSFLINKQRIEGKLAKSKFFAPIYDYGTDEVKIYEFSPAIYNGIENVFTKAGYEYTSADCIVTHNAVQGNWWIVSKRDSSPISQQILDKYNLMKKKIEIELTRRSTIPTPEEQEKYFQKYLDGVAKKAAQKNADNDEIETIEEQKSIQPAVQASQTTKKVVDLF